MVEPLPAKSRNAKLKAAVPAAAGRAWADMRDPEQAVKCLKVLAHGTRLLILEALREGERTVSELERMVGGTQSNVSQHLRLMKDREILTSRRDGNQVFYAVRDPRVFAIVDAVKEVFCKQ